MENNLIKPAIYISKCIEFAPCRFNGQIIASEVVQRLKPIVEFRPVCAEMEIGLGVPRESLRIVLDNNQFRLIQSATGKDCTTDMQNFADSYLNSIDIADGWILKGRSPSCGIGDVKYYMGVGKMAHQGKCKGLFGEKVIEKFGYLGIEDEGRLLNFKLRENFLTKIFTFARFREIKKQNSMGALVKFQAENKLLLLAYHQQEMRIMGRIVANPEKQPVAQVLTDYETHLHTVFARPARSNSHLNVLMHALGYFSKELSAQEKAFFLDSLEQFQAGKVPLSVPVNLIRSWIIRFQNAYLLSQTYFEPYPQKLVEITDSGKGRDF
ncbi:DUF1722 domain-containing protein [candidate division KSB1 bacterium]|nr:DUF1722 domain-containing protein [candidate division KSB1 bacterium]